MDDPTFHEWLKRVDDEAKEGEDESGRYKKFYKGIVA